MVLTLILFSFVSLFILGDKFIPSFRKRNNSLSNFQIAEFERDFNFVNNEIEKSFSVLHFQSCKNLIENLENKYSKFDNVNSKCLDLKINLQKKEIISLT